MDVNASIIDQQLTGILKDHPDWLPDGDANKQRSAAFVLLCMGTCLDIPMEEAAELLTEGGNDAGVDGIHLGRGGRWRVSGDNLSGKVQGEQP